MNNSNHVDTYKLKLFVTLFPNFKDKITDFTDIGDKETIFYMSDGSKAIFDEVYKTVKYIEPRPYTVESLPKEEWLAEFSRKLKRRLSMANMTRKELSARTGLSINTICRYVKGERVPDIFVINEIAKALNCDSIRFIDLNYLL
jgi:hypothetical protein